MKAAVWYGRQDIRVEDREIPAPAPKEVQIKVVKAGICGSDLHEWWAGPIFTPVEVPHPLSGKKAPLTSGHEFSGTIAAVGSNVRGFQVGDRVTANSVTWCGECDSCKKGWYSLCKKAAYLGFMRDGAFAELINVPSESVFKLPDNIPFEWGAMVEPFAVAIHAHRRGRTAIGENVVVIGAGTIGLMTIQAAKVAGAANIFAVEISEKRREAAEAQGAIVLDSPKDAVVETILCKTGGHGADVVLEVVGQQETVDLALSVARTKGRVVIIGIFEDSIKIDWNKIVMNELEVLGHMNNGGEFPQVIELMLKGLLRPAEFVTGRIGLSEVVEKGYKQLVKDKSHIKILVDPNE